ncbi:MAG: tetratricopeptide repeat protein [Bacteroidales bacterium]|nr:tetratricopeptide repeat protein [Bacteroidales bacterium]
MLKEDNNFDNRFNGYLIRQFQTIYREKKSYFWTEEEFEVILEYFCHVNVDFQKFKYALRLALRNFPKSPMAHVYAARYFQTIGEYSKAVEFYKFCLRKKGDLPDENILYDMIQCWDALKDYDDAIKELKLYVTDIAPFSPVAWFVLGQAYVYAGKQAEAIDAYLYSIAINSESASTYFNLGNVYSQSDDYLRAIQSYEKSLQYDGDEKYLTHYYLGECYSIIGKYDRAIENYKNCIKIRPDFSDAYCELAKEYLAAEDYILALSWVDKALELDEHNSDYFKTKAMILYETDRGEEAEKAFLAGLAENNLNIECSVNLAALYLDMGQPDKAIPLLRFQAATLKDEPVLQVTLSVCYFYAGQQQEAYVRLHSAVEMDEGELDWSWIKDYPEFNNDPNVLDIISEKVSN